MSGEIPDGGMLDVLREIETRRITGRLRFTAEGKTGDVAIVAGQIALDQETMKDGGDPVEVMLKLRRGHYVVHQRLPSLPISHGDDDHRSGSLEVHVPADLMNYCEQSGVTGTLRLQREANLAELVYDAGELLAIRLDGKEDADLSAVFSWDDGSFDIDVGRDVKALVPKSVPPPVADDSSEREPTTHFVKARADDTGKNFLKVVEVALTDVVETRERVRPKSHTSPARAPAPSVRPPPAAMPKMTAPTKRRRENTVRIAYLAGDDESALAAIDHVARTARGKPTPAPAAVEMSIARESAEHSIPEATRSDPPPAKEPEATKPAPEPRSNDASPPDALGPIGWTVVVLAAGVAAYYLLSHLLAAS
jgi:hypothetical protein